MTATPQTYSRIFEGHGDGVAILEDLTARFYDVRSFVRGGVEGARQTDFNEGRRSVVHFILSQIGQVQRGETGEEDNAEA
jgi:hypothetical protein